MVLSIDVLVLPLQQAGSSNKIFSFKFTFMDLSINNCHSLLEFMLHVSDERSPPCRMCDTCDDDEELLGDRLPKERLRNPLQVPRRGPRA